VPQRNKGFVCRYHEVFLSIYEARRSGCSKLIYHNEVPDVAPCNNMLLTTISQKICLSVRHFMRFISGISCSCRQYHRNHV
jgi:hypothetical protein